MDRPAYLKGLDEYFASRYSDYVKLSAIDGYRMPDMIYVAPDGNVARRDPSEKRLCRQADAEVLLERFKAGLEDTDFTFSFRFRTLREALHDPFEKVTFKKLLPAALKRCDETAESAGRMLSVEPRFWEKIVRGKLYPEKNLVLALALTSRMQLPDVIALLTVCGFAFSSESVRDVVCEYLLAQKIFNPEMRDACLAEYHITSLPIAREGE